MRQSNDFLPKLLGYIELSNKIPSDFEFPNIIKLEEIVKNFGGSGNLTKDYVNAYKEVFKDFPTDLHTYIFEERENDKTYANGVLERIDLVEFIHRCLNSLARAVTSEHTSDDSVDNINEVIKDLLFDPFTNYVLMTDASISIDSNGFLKTKTNEFFDLVANHKIDARRIRCCLICQKIFWAYRIDKWTCSQSCGNTLRQRNWQEQNKDEYNEKRRRNYAYKKTMKNKRRKNNGTL